jgi:PAS domain S-box-containing protein
MKFTYNQVGAGILRKRAMELLKAKPINSVSHLSEAEILLLLHEFEVNQIELELQNEDLIDANSITRDYIEKYSELYDFAPSGYFTLSRSGEIVELNLSGANMLGKERLYLKDSQLGFFVSDETKPIFNLFFEKIFFGTTKESCEVTFAINGNSETNVYLCGIAIEDGKKCIINAVDITSRRQAEKVLSISEIRYRRLFETAKDGILILDAKTGKILDVNPFLIDLLGYSRKQFIEKAIWELGCFKDIAANREKFEELQKKEYIRYENLPLETAGGQKVNVEFVSNIYSENAHKVIQCNIRALTNHS